MTDRQSAPRATGYLPEVQGLRTVALALVAIYHIWFDRVSGGVDVFLVISTYLMTRSLTARAEAGTITRPLSHLIGKFARLLPAAVTAIVLILATFCLLHPAPLWDSAIESARASLFYVENQHLQNQSVDYLDPGAEGPSPFQHFWSLSVQGQAFILWALLHCLGDLLARLLGQPVRRVQLLIFVVVFGASFGYALQFVAVDQPRAYFDTLARLWEFAAGSILALVQPWVRVPVRLRPWLGWLGLAGVLTCGWLLPVEASFPGWAALWPVASTVLVILGCSEDARGAGVLLANPLLASAGIFTYALYLVHWPVLVYFLSVTELERANWWQGAVVLVISVAVSLLIAKTVEQPMLRFIRRSKRAAGARAHSVRTILRRWWRENWRPGLAGILLMTIGLGAVSGATSLGEAKILAARQQLASLDIANLGANAADPQAPPPAELLDFVRKDTSVPGLPCDLDDPLATELCFDLPATTGTPDRKILALGNSHSIQFNGALLEAVERQPSWSLHTRGAWSCTIELAKDAADGDPCAELWANALDWIEREQPDAVVLFGTQSTLTQEISQWELLRWLDLARERSPETQFVAVRDNPRFDRDLPECAAEFGHDAPECRVAAVHALDPLFVEALLDLGVIWVDLQEVICPDGFCTPSQGGLWVFQDDNHLTDAYTRSLAQEFAQRVHPELGWWPAEVYTSGALVDRSPPGDIETMPRD
ncbi:acyltransferase family protein [Gulosibacter chungangensis]|uniref:Acyltransferase n=1 Tax=Gulosibacter chungangensis TaxID=979746 RepID=A0A7J5BEQ9_9MICO|nr:acyltransferase family protein [Gulosibacter chungangensis]KAB1644746.1 acyltransferase [Gulosibacter chungangensis]